MPIAAKRSFRLPRRPCFLYLLGVFADVGTSFGMENPMGLFDSHHGALSKRKKEIWGSNYERLSQFCQTHRGTNLRRRLLTEDPKLHLWMKQQYHHYQLDTRRGIKISSLRIQRMERLKLLGFDITKHWDRNLEEERPARRDDAKWEDYFDQLKQYWIRNGKTYKHLWKNERRLSKWKDEQMQEYKKHGLRSN